MEGKQKFDTRDEPLEATSDSIRSSSDRIPVFTRCPYNMRELAGVFIVCDHKTFTNKDELLFGKSGSQRFLSWACFAPVGAPVLNRFFQSHLHQHGFMPSISVVLDNSSPAGSNIGALL